jgi:hypothetical protein
MLHPMRRRWIAGLVGAALVVGASLFAWRATRPEPPPPSSTERRYEDIDRAEYERWMQDLGYTE